MKKHILAYIPAFILAAFLAPALAAAQVSPLAWPPEAYLTTTMPPRENTPRAAKSSVAVAQAAEPTPAPAEAAPTEPAQPAPAETAPMETAPAMADSGIPSPTSRPLVGVITFQVNYTGGETKTADACPTALAPGLPSLPAALRPTVAAGVIFRSLGSIAGISSAGISVDSDNMNYFTTIANPAFNVTLARQAFKVTSRTPASETQTTHNADNLNVEWKPGQAMLKPPWGGSLAVGAMVYYDRSTVGPKKDFYQPYISMEKKLPRADVALGIDFTKGDIPEETGFFLTAKTTLMPKLTVAAEYRQHDFQKLAINNVILPKEGIDCSTCKSDAISLSLSYMVNDTIAATLAVFDLNDLAAPMGSLSVNREF